MCIGNMTLSMQALGSISTYHVIIFLAIILLLFGGKKLPELARGIGKGLRIFRDELHGIQKEIDEPPPSNPKMTQQDKPPVENSNTEKKA